jgi:hypothetical protein
MPKKKAILRGWLVLLLLEASVLLTDPAFSHDALASLPPNPAIQGMLAGVTAAQLSTYLDYLTGSQPVLIGGSPFTFLTRYSRDAVSCQKSTQYAYEQFQSLGLPVLYQEYLLYSSGIRRNVIAEQTGALYPERIYILCAHLDSYSEHPYILAPGADDNASGSAAVFLVAGILRQYRMACTIRYVLFSGEEQGLYGSEAYASLVSGRGDDIRGVLNLDSLGYNTKSSPPVMEIHTRVGNNTPDQALANLFVDAIQAYQLNLQPEVVGDSEPGSDHASFWDFGYPAILAIEDYEDYSPEYHKTTDTSSTLDMSYYTNFVKAVLATTAHLAELLPAEPQNWKTYLPVILRDVF